MYVFTEPPHQGQDVTLDQIFSNLDWLPYLN